MKTMRRILPCLLIAGFAASAQEFEVVSIKPNHSGSGGSHSHGDRGMIAATNVTLSSLIVDAYGLNDYQIEGPPWLKEERYDFTARFTETSPDDRKRVYGIMLQKMLAERFKLQTHREEKSSAVYGLVVTKAGIKFREAANPNGDGSDAHGEHYEGKGIAMAALADFLLRFEDLPVVDMTGLKGRYDLTLDWSPEPKNPKPGDPPPAGPFPYLPEALQEQLGLKLENRKAPIDFLVVDHAEKIPTEN